ncbi:MAG: hypothetical protein LBD06_09720, partial [Candidatus Accumulibacter sp.]|nr:hypothetical protein [Accumulibacter sp.]
MLASQARFGKAGKSAEETPPETAAPWSPAAFDDAALAASLAPSVLAQALELARSHPVIEVIAGDGDTPPMARLPMASVIFYARNSLAHARCDCAQGGACAHVALAVWAFRQADQANGSQALRATVALRRDEHAGAGPGPTQGERAGAFIARCEAMLLDLWKEGAAAAPLAFEARLRMLEAEARALDWRWMEESLDELEQLLRALNARSTRFEPRRLPAAVAELWAR